MYYDKDGRPLEMMEWAELSQRPGYRRVDCTPLSKGYVVSTVWIGLCLDIGTIPTILETAIIRNGRFIRVYGRAPTLEIAKAMHKAAVKDQNKAIYKARMKRRSERTT